MLIPLNWIELAVAQHCMQFSMRNSDNKKFENELHGFTRKLRYKHISFDSKHRTDDDNNNNNTDTSNENLIYD